MDFYADSSYYGVQSSQESLCSYGSRLFTPPASKPKHNIFFSSDDTLYKRESKKFTIPRIEIECEPVFNVEVTDFSEPSPKNIVLTFDNPELIQKGAAEEKEKLNNKSWKEKANSFVQQKSYSIDIHENPFVEISQVKDTDKFLSISGKKFNKQKSFSSSLQDLSSSTSSINSGIHESNLDLSHIDSDSPVKHKNWKSPDEVRHGHSGDISKVYENKAISYPSLNKNKYFSKRNKSISEENLNDKLTDYERLEVIKLLRDWSLNGSDSKTELNLVIKDERNCFEKANVEKSEKRINKTANKYASEPNLSTKNLNKDGLIVIAKYNSDNNIKIETNADIELMHRCQFRNCIFNEKFVIEPTIEKSTNLKSILKSSKEYLQESECLNNIANSGKTPKLGPSLRRFSEIIETKPFNSQLVRCDSLERLTHLQKRPNNFKKFPESYIVSKKNSTRKIPLETMKKSPKVIVLRRRKTWKSCSDIKNRKTVRKCCRFAKKHCPIMKTYETSRKTQSCLDIERDYPARLAALMDNPVGAFDCKIKAFNVAHDFSFVF